MRIVYFIIISTFTFKISKNQGLANSLNEIADMNNVLGAKNLLPNNATSLTYRGITFTVNSDGSVTANGTATSNVPIYLVYSFNLVSGEYILSDEANSTDTNVQMILDTPDGAQRFATCYGATRKRKFTLNQAYTLRCFIWIGSGTEVDNVTFKPMLRPASIQDDTYVPYSMTNRELSKKVQHVRVDFKQNIIDQLQNTEYYESADGLIKKSVYIYLPSMYTPSNVECICTQTQTSSCFGMTTAAIFSSSGSIYVYYNALIQNITAKALAESSTTECYIDFFILMK